METLVAQTFSFGDFELDGAKRLLLKEGKPVSLNSKAFDLLSVLVENHGQIVPKDELLDKVWEGQFVEENNLTVHISALRKIFGEKKGEHKFIVTIPGKGYKFVAEVNDKLHNEIIIENHKFERVFIDEEIEEYRNVTKEKPKISAWLKNYPAAILAVALVLAAIGGYFLVGGKTDFAPAVSFANSSVKQLTTNGNVELAALSPDGKLFAYTTKDAGQKSLRLGYVDGGNHLLLRPAVADALYFELAFAPDSGQIYFSYKDDKTPNAALYRIRISGGVHEKIADSVENFSLSPDGKQIVFGRRDSNKDLLLVSNLDGSNEREVASFPKNETFVFNSISWSPDGNRLAFSKLKDAKSLGNDLAILEISSGKVDVIKSEIWRDTAKTVWLKDGSGVIANAVKYDSWTSVPQFHVFHIEIPSGNAHQITNDLSSYGSSLDLSQNAILTIEHRQLNNIWIAPADNLGAAKQITFGAFGKYDGLWGLDFTPDGKIIYTNSDTKSQFISEMNAAGSSSKPLTMAGIIDSVLNVSNDGHYIVFQSIRNGGNFNIWRMDIDGGNPQQLTFGGKDFQSSISADSRWVYYKSWENDVGELRRVSIDGGETEILNDKETSWLSFSPDGKYFAASYKTDKYRLAIFDAQTNQVVKQFDLPKNATLSLGSHWSPDSRAVAFRDWNDGYWLQPIAGGEPHKMEGLPKEKLYNFAWSKDGKQFAFVRGQEIRDVVLFRHLK